MKLRDDIHGEPQAPRKYEEFLLRVGGKTPLGEPAYRLIHADTRYMWQGGLWKEWSEELSMQERGGFVSNDDGLLVPSQHKPERIVLEVKEILKYPHMKDRWLLERWVPVFMYGARAAWERIVVPDTNVSLLGPFPENGDYELVAGPAEELPSFSFLREAIQQCEAREDEHEGTVEEIISMRVEQAEFEYEEALRKQQDEDTAIFRDQLSPWNSSSIDAGRWRQETASRAGIREHAGN